MLFSKIKKYINSNETCLYFFFSPGVIITEIHKRGGMSEEDYAKVNICFKNTCLF